LETPLAFARSTSPCSTSRADGWLSEPARTARWDCRLDPRSRSADYARVSRPLASRRAHVRRQSQRNTIMAPTRVARLADTEQASVTITVKKAATDGYVASASGTQDHPKADLRGTSRHAVGKQPVDANCAERGGSRRKHAIEPLLFGHGQGVDRTSAGAATEVDEHLRRLRDPALQPLRLRAPATSERPASRPRACRHRAPSMSGRRR
jgi:hypothetical protein